jgi:CRISPR-associated protein Cas4
MESLSKILINYGHNKLEEPRRPRERHWPSDTGKCPRALVYQWRGEQVKSPDGRLFFIFSDGEMHHQIIAKHLEDAGVQITMKEAPIRDKERNISGKLDALLKIDGKYYVLEIKSINRYGFEEILKEGPREEHVLQLQLYLYYVNNLFKIETKIGILLYKNKDTSRFADFPIEFDETYALNFFEYLKGIEKHVADNTLPDRPYERKDWHCQYCDYQLICWQGVPRDKLPQISDEELAGLLGELIFAKEQRKEYEDKEDQLTEMVKQLFKEKGMTQGQIGSYIVRLEEMTMRRLNQAKLAESLGDKLDDFYEEKTYPKLTIKELE